MQKMIISYFVYILLIDSHQINAWNIDPAPEVYEDVKDIYNPERVDYLMIQDYLSFNDRPNLERLKDDSNNSEVVLNTVKKFRLIGDSKMETPKSGLFSVNCADNARENCIVLYSSFNKNHPEALNRLMDTIKNSDYVGHVLYCLGGWPNTENGDLVLAHVPYAYKPCLCKQAQLLGFKRALWLDLTTIPVASLNLIFEIIQFKGYFVVRNNHMVGPYFNEKAAHAFQLSLRETFKIPCCSTEQFGVDFTKQIGQELVDQWYLAAKDRDAFYSPLHNQNALAVILHKLHIDDFISRNRIINSPSNQIKQNTLFVVDNSLIEDITIPL